MGADAESSRTESRTDSWSPDGARNPWSAPTTELWAPTRIRGWFNYYGAFYRSELYAIAARIDEHLVRWAMQKFKRLRGQPTKAWKWLDAARQREPQLFAHWHLLAATPRRTVGAV